MQISNDLEKKFQEQITLEFEASITYRQLAIEADEQDLPGISEWSVSYTHLTLPTKRIV